MGFRDQRRQKFLDEQRYRTLDRTLNYRAQDSNNEIHNESLVPEARSEYAWFAASDLLKLFLLRYTAGQPLSELSDQFPAVIRAFDIFIPLDNPYPNEAHTIEITQLEAYVYVMWLLALCRLLGHEELVPTVIGWLDSNGEFNRGRDGLFESVVEKLTGTRHQTERVLLHPDAYRPLAKATVPDAVDRPALVKEFVENWYKHMGDCYWQGTHTDKEGSSYFGYWCLEAALVTFLWDIDDTSYRDHLVYPKDLVDYARQKFPLRAPEGTGNARLRCEAGQPCPNAGWWFTPAQSGSRRHFKQDETMPDVGSTYGHTIWQWDTDQS